MKRIAVLASGGGTNLKSIIDHFADLGPRAAGEVVLVASDRPQAGALSRARAANIEAVVLREREPQASEIIDLLTERRVDMVALAGFLKLIPTAVVDRFAGRMVNVHPALLPLHGGPGMYGIRVHQAVLNSRATVSGPTVHYVTHEYDSGPVLAQWAVGIAPNDDAPALAARVLVAEHGLYPRVIQALAAGDESRFPMRPDAAYMAKPPITPEAITRDIIAAFS